MLEEIRLQIVEFMNIIIINKGIFFINLWNIIHFFSGALLMFLLLRLYKKLEVKKAFLFLFFLLVLWELFEFSIRTNIPGLFRDEDVRNVLWDLIVGMLGGLFFFRFKKK